MTLKIIALMMRKVLKNEKRQSRTPTEEDILAQLTIQVTLTVIASTTTTKNITLVGNTPRM